MQATTGSSNHEKPHNPNAGQVRSGPGPGQRTDRSSVDEREERATITHPTRLQSRRSIPARINKLARGSARPCGSFVPGSRFSDALFLDKRAASTRFFFRGPLLCAASWPFCARLQPWSKNEAGSLTLGPRLVFCPPKKRPILSLMAHGS